MSASDGKVAEKTLPESFFRLTNLQKLDLRDNQFTTLPESLGNLTQLQYLYLLGNKLSTIPESLKAFFERLKAIGEINGIDHLLNGYK